MPLSKNVVKISVIIVSILLFLALNLSILFK